VTLPKNHCGQALVKAGFMKLIFEIKSSRFKKSCQQQLHKIFPSFVIIFMIKQFFCPPQKKYFELKFWRADKSDDVFSCNSGVE
jgi:hypothetical protein